MEFIGSILLVGATITCVVMVFLATLIMGVKILSPLTDLIYQDLVNGPREQHPSNRADALFFTGVIPLFLAFLTLITEFVKLEEGGHTVTLWIFNKYVVKGCAEVLVILGLIRIVLATLRAVRQYINRAHCQCCKSGLCDANDKAKG
jgi:hypothetical protein